MMAAISSKYPLGSPQEHIPMCEKHSINIDITCEDCDEFICSQCAKTDHKDHDWKTIPTAGSLRRRDLQKTLGKIKEKDVKTSEEKIRNASKQLEVNQKRFDSEVSKLQKHYDAIVSKLDEIRKNIETKLREVLERENAELKRKQLDLKKKQIQINDLVTFLDEKHNTMSDYGLIDNLRDLTNLVFERDSEIKRGDHLVEYRRGDISEVLLKSMMGQIFDWDAITITERGLIQYGDEGIYLMEAINEESSFVSDTKSNYIERINIRRKKREKIKIDANDACVTKQGDVYVTDRKNNSIVRLFSTGSISKVFSTAPLHPGGICQSTDDGLLLTLRDAASDFFQPNSQSRRLVRHVTLTGDVIREYEYQEDGRTRLFNAVRRVRQNGNTDICVVNMKNETLSDLMILSLSGSLKWVYRGQTLAECFFTDVACDSYCNILACDMFNSKIHLLCPNGNFIRYLLTETEVKDPWSMSLYKSTLWVGDNHGLVKVFQYKA
ncbi:uncharacterized protein LOC128180032 [Crassostrea angulata]|uniref:uncharacterized protein LOC128180032 n=1 Tax=Magallana angulata TaxID=2784310 RepID=UPI0022B188FF|nr:uncharacterized protein LOC128180032 [Crassostrea angulata]